MILAVKNLGKNLHISVFSAPTSYLEIKPLRGKTVLCKLSNILNTWCMSTEYQKQYIIADVLIKENSSCKKQMVDISTENQHLVTWNSLGTAAIPI